MSGSRWLGGMALGVLATAGIAISASQAQEASNSLRAARHATAQANSGIGSFTPAAGDPKLAAVLSRMGLSGSTGFRFTPSESKKGIGRSVTVAVRARSSRAAQEAERLATSLPSTVSFAPIAYNLGVSVGWKRFAVSGDVAHIDLAGQEGSREAVDVGVSYTGRKLSGRIKAAADRPLANVPRLMAEAPSYSIDVGGSYALTRNLDVTAGVRYKAERNRLPRLTESDDRRDSQAVYIGTAFRF